MAYELLVGLQVDDEESYSNYRKQMTPLLESQGGGFRYDFKIEKTLISEKGAKINRTFVIYFKDKKAMEQLFSSAEYKSIKSKYYKLAVSSTTVISEYSKES